MNEELRRLGEVLGFQGVGLDVFTRGRGDESVILREARSAESDRERLGREKYGLSGPALQYFVEHAPPIAPMIEGAEQTMAWDATEGRYRPARKGDPEVPSIATEARRWKPAAKPAPVAKPVKLRENRVEDALKEIFEHLGLSPVQAALAAKGRD